MKYGATMTDDHIMITTPGISLYDDNIALKFAFSFFVSFVLLFRFP
jgi:hypothetical protein